MTDVTFESVSLGDELPPIQRELTQEDITKFAVADLDYNPVHLDYEWMEATKRFGDEFFTGAWDMESTVGHGMLTMSWMSSLVTDWALESGGFMTLIDTTLTRPATPGDTITITGTITEKHPVKDPKAAYAEYRPEAEHVDETSGDNFVTIEIEVTNQDDQTLGFGDAYVRLP